MRYIRGHVGYVKSQIRMTNARWTVEDHGYLTPCWIAHGWADNGYVRVRFDGRRRLAHRAMYEQEIGPIPAGYHVDHLCMVRACVNPAHLEAVPPAENNRRARAAKAARH